MPKEHPTFMTAARALQFGRGDVGGCSFEMHGVTDAAFQQLVVKDADASSDIEESPGHGGNVVEAL